MNEDELYHWLIDLQMRGTALDNTALKFVEEYESKSQNIIETRTEVSENVSQGHYTVHYFEFD